MSLDRRYILLAHLCSAMSIICFALAGADAAIGLVALLILGVEWFLVSGPGRKPLPRWAVNGALLVTTLGLAFELITTRQGGEEFVSIIARYMVWLQLIKHAEPKTSRDQGQLLALTAMLVIAAALTNVSVFVGLALLIYLPLLLTTVMHFQLYAGQLLAARDNPGARRHAPGRVLGLPLAAGRAINRHLATAISFAAFAIVTGAIAVFILIPRGVGESILGDIAPPSAGAVTGFSDTVQLGGRGVISQSAAVALEARIVIDGVPARPPQTFHLRGAVLDEYDKSRGTWQRSRRIEEQNKKWWSHANDPASDKEGVFQDITIRNKQSPHLFTVWYAEKVHITSLDDIELARNPYDGSVLWPEKSGLVNYRIVSDPDPRPTDRYGTKRPDQDFPLLPRPRDETFDEGPIALLAQQILTEADLNAQSPDLDKANAIKDYLERTCAYTLDRSPPSFGEDPIEMFLFRTQQGHCEYFASAMTALAKSLGLRARVVTGFVASEFDEATQTYVVRQSAAHAWSEVYIDGAWQTFDPASLEALRAQEHTGIMSALRRAFDRFESLWVRSVVAFDQGNQADFLETQSKGASGAVKRITALLDRLLPQDDTRIEIQRSRRALGRLLIYCAIGLAGVGLVIIGIRHARASSRPTRKRRRKPLVRPAEDRRRTRQQGFYRAMLRLLERRKLAKPDWRPPLDHARTIGATDSALADATERLTRLYYASRFGGRLLTTAELDEAKSLLDALSRERGATT